jgi:RHS repeat-associated protein
MTLSAVCTTPACFPPPCSTGKERDAESGNDYFGARYYASSMGRFLSPDPKQMSKARMLDPQQWNMYGYARNSPLVAYDPDGKEVRFKSEDQAKQAVAALQRGLPKDQRGAISQQFNKDTNHFDLTVDHKAAAGAGRDSLLGRLDADATSSKVAQVNLVGGGDKLTAIQFGVASIKTTFSLDDKNLNGITLPEFGGKDHPLYNNVGLNSSGPGVTEVDASTSSDDLSSTLMHELTTHVDSFFTTGNARLSDENHLQNQIDNVEKEVQKNEKQP